MSSRPSFWEQRNCRRHRFGKPSYPALARTIYLESARFPNPLFHCRLKISCSSYAGGRTSFRPADPDVIAKNLGKEEEVNHDVGISPVAGVGYSTGGDPNDPYTGQRGWTTTTGVLVHGGHQRRDPKTIQADRKTMAAELKEKQLPTGTTAPSGGRLPIFSLARQEERQVRPQDIRARVGQSSFHYHRQFNSPCCCI